MRFFYDFDKERRLPMISATVLSLIMVLLFVSLGFAEAENQASAVGLDALIDEALHNNPDLKATEDNVDVLSEKPSQEESLENPRLGLGVLNLPVNTYSFDQEPMTQKQISLQQRIPFPGKLPLKGAIARKDVDIAKEGVAEKRNNLILQVKTIYWNLLLIDKTVAVTKENRDLLRDFVKTAETRYSVGTGIQQDVLKAQVELSKMLDRLILQEEIKENLFARLNSLLYRPPEERLKDIAWQDLDALKLTPFPYTVEELEKMAEENRPELASAKQRVERSRLGELLAKKNYYPDFDVAVSYGQRNDRPDFVSGSVMITIPLWYKTKEDRKLAEERARTRQVEDKYTSLKNDIFFRLRDAVLEISKYKDQLDLYQNGLIPQGRAALESAMAGYGVNKVDFITLVNNQITLYNYRIEYYKALTGFENTISDIEATIGKRLY
jgi:cobalt-zinc-cadmium efflux system outer membrane protein